MQDSQNHTGVNEDFTEISKAAKAACDRKFWQTEELNAEP